MAELVGWPDAELVLIDYFTAAPPGVHTCNTIPPVELFNERLPIIDVTRTGGDHTTGTWADGYLVDEPSMDLDIWAASLESGQTTAAHARAALVAMLGYRAHGAAAGRVRNISGPRRRPDVSQNITRLGRTTTIPLRLV
ncbi:hypothetical protein [Actinomadura vinacea]|uniref:hypothetical protein n=1 Tax=Actinomadura vinacea TaxID=115336 RepID=UPI0031E2C946